MQKLSFLEIYFSSPSFIYMLHAVSRKVIALNKLLISKLFLKSRHKFGEPNDDYETIDHVYSDLPLSHDSDPLLGYRPLPSSPPDSEILGC